MSIHCSRAWLSPISHSSGFIMCYYDKECVNWNYRFFIRIADCSNAWTFMYKITQVQMAIRFIDGLIAVIAGKRRSVSYSEGRSCTTAINGMRTTVRARSVTVHKELGTGYYRNIRITRADNLGHKKEVVRLHCDPETCTLEEWENKKAVLTYELVKFKEFLSTVQRFRQSEAV